MPRQLADLLSALPLREQREYLEFSEDIQEDMTQIIEDTGEISPLRRLRRLLGPELIPRHDRNRWMLM